jgi:glycosyltransferase involved in cell wall biosynthesis
VIYISYDGATEPLGQSQVVAYLERLADECDVRLISFEKPDDDRQAIATRLADVGVGWHPLTYHRRPPVASTAWDVVRGSRMIDRVARELDGPLILHGRSYVPALMALRAKPRVPSRFLFDIRGFWADERVEGGIWRRGRVYRAAKRYEHRFFSEADAVVTLTRRSVDQIREWMGANEAPVEVIPTCVDVDRFARSSRGGGPRKMIWAGTVSGWYDFPIGVALARETGFPLTVLTRQVDEARRGLNGLPAEVRTISVDRMPHELAPGDVGLCTVRPSFSKLASAPTRVAEYLAAGMPFVALSGVGDLDEIADQGVGVILRGSNRASLTGAAAQLRALIADADLPARCREVARRQFSLEAGVESYRRIYEKLSEQ